MVRIQYTVIVLTLRFRMEREEEKRREESCCGTIRLVFQLDLGM